MFERYTEEARLAVVHASEDAIAYQHAHIHPEHLIVGLLRQGGVVAEVLAPDASAWRRLTTLTADTDFEKIPDSDAPALQIPFLPATKATLESALREALSLSSNSVEPHHLLLGVCRVAPDHNLDIEKMTGKNVEQIRHDVNMATIRRSRKLRQKAADWTDELTKLADIFLEAVDETLDAMTDQEVNVANLAAHLHQVGEHAYKFEQGLSAITLPRRTVASLDRKLGATVGTFTLPEQQ